jgi:hypothetical protein
MFKRYNNTLNVEAVRSWLLSPGFACVFPMTVRTCNHFLSLPSLFVIITPLQSLTMFVRVPAQHIFFWVATRCRYLFGAGRKPRRVFAMVPVERLIL